MISGGAALPIAIVCAAFSAHRILRTQMLTQTTNQQQQQKNTNWTKNLSLIHFEWVAVAVRC